MEIIVSNYGVYLIIQGIIGAETIEYTAISYIDIGEGLQGQRVVQQFFRYAEG
jgi:hypothetical protein